MKANELMVGDYLRLKKRKAIVKVEAITESGITFKYIGGRGTAFYDQIAPIPLTPEILEKNGFEKRNNYQYKYRDNSCKIVISIAPQVEIDGKSLGRPPVNILLEGATFDVNITFDGFVHYLQHALRFCEIEKEITI